MAVLAILFAGAFGTVDPGSISAIDAIRFDPGSISAIDGFTSLGAEEATGEAESAGGFG